MINITSEQKKYFSTTHPIQVKRETVIPTLLTASLPRSLSDRLVIQVQNAHDFIGKLLLEAVFAATPAVEATAASIQLTLRRTDDVGRAVSPTRS